MMSPFAAPLPPALPALARRGLLLGLALLVAGCAQLNGTAAPRLSKDGAATSTGYKVTPANLPAIRARALDTVNNTRSAAGLGPLRADDALNRAAERHSASMARQRRAWAFGEDGSSPIQRATEAGFSGGFIGEMVSETYQSEVQTIATWAGNADLRALLLDPRAARMGIAAHQDPDSKLWWTLNIGD